jgi:hypothetical protein
LYSSLIIDVNSSGSSFVDSEGAPFLFVLIVSFSAFTTGASSFALDTIDGIGLSPIRACVGLL